MRFFKNEQTDLKTKSAWEKNWENIGVDQALEIFNYERVKKQMAIFMRVLPKGEKILEGGCGLGPYLIRLRQLGYDVEGLDYNEAPVQKILAYDSSLPVRVGDVNELPYPEAVFGGYLSLGVIEHFTEGPRQAIREARRVLKPGGVFIVAVPRCHLFMRLMTPVRFLKSRKFLRKLFGKPEDNHYWEHYFKKGELMKILETEGFRVREIHPLDHAHALVSFSGIFRDKKTYDEANALGLKLGAWCEKYLPWATAAQMTLICYKKQ